MKEKQKRELIGIVVSDKADKTITVKVETYKKDPKYIKKIQSMEKELNILRNMQLMTKTILLVLVIKFV